jgi:hypothetical protein
MRLLIILLKGLGFGFFLCLMGFFVLWCHNFVYDFLRGYFQSSLPAIFGMMMLVLIVIPSTLHYVDLLITEEESKDVSNK